MKTVILCGGYGRRLKEETEYRPKPLIKIGGMPILWHIMKIYSHYGFKEFILCLGYKGDMIKSFFLNFEELSNDFTLDLRSKEKKISHHENCCLEDWKIHFVDTGLDTQTGGRVARIKHLIGDDENFFLTYGDGVARININELYKYHKRINKILTLTAVTPQSPYGIIEIEEGVVKTFKEKPSLQGKISGGFFVCNRKIFDYLSTDENCIFEEEPMRNITKDNQLGAFELNDFWFGVDTAKHVDQLNKFWETNPRWKIWDEK